MTKTASVLLLCILFGLHLPVDAQPKAKIATTHDNHDFGTIREKDGSVSHAFVIRNEGNAPLTISQVIASCGCTTPRWSKQAIAAGQAGTIEVAYNPAGRPGAFQKSVSVYSNGSKDPLVLTVKGTVESAAPKQPEGRPIFTAAETTHDFGIIKEEDGDAFHIFKFRNTGNVPLIITNVQTSCGCTEPEWTREPIAPGAEGEIFVAYDPTNRPGPFQKHITVYLNERYMRQRLTITGDVVPRTERLVQSFSDTIGTVQMERKAFLFYAIRPQEISKQEIWIQNFSDQDLTLSLTGAPAHIAVELPTTLKAHDTQRLKITVDGKQLLRQGHYRYLLEWKATSATQTVTAQVPITMNVIDDFATLAATDRSTAPVCELDATLIAFGKIKNRSFLGLGNKPVVRTLTLTNKGKSTLHLHDIKADDPRIQIGGAKKLLKPGESLPLQLAISPKEFTGTMVTELYIVSDDPQGPVREVRITAEK